MVNAKVAVVVFFYDQIKGFFEGFLSNMVAGIPVDAVIAALGYYGAKRNWMGASWFWEGLFYGAVASLGKTEGLGLFHLGKKESTPQTQSYSYAPIQKAIIW